MSNSEGWCAGGCGARVTRFGPTAKTMCEGCSAVLAVWRALPAKQRGRVVYGRTVDGAYVQADATGV